MTSFYSNEEKIDNFLVTKGYEKVLSFGKDRIYKFPIKNKVQNFEKNIYINFTYFFWHFPKFFKNYF